MGQLSDSGGMGQRQMLHARARKGHVRVCKRHTSHASISFARLPYQGWSRPFFPLGPLVRQPPTPLIWADGPMTPRATCLAQR